MADHDEDFAEFMTARWPALQRFATLLCGDSEEGEDLAQRALVKAYAAWPRIRAREAVEGYTRTTLTRLFLTDRRRRRLTTVPLDQGREVAAPSVDTVGREAMWSQVLRLPPRQRAVLVLRYYEDLSEAAIAETLGCSRGTVKSQCSKALANLRASVPADLLR